MKVLSLFDGISCGQLALRKAGIKYDDYYASEIKPHAISVTKEHFPNTIHIGDVTKIRYEKGTLFTEVGTYDIGEIDLLIGGSPCQDFSIANTKQLGLVGEKSKLFYEYLRLLREIKPTYFFLENVKMKKDSELQLNKYLGVQGIHFNSNLVSYQSRPRIYWTNITGFSLPKDRNIDFQDYKDTDYDYCKQFMMNRTPSRIKMWNGGEGKTGFTGICKNVTNEKKIGCITRKQDRCPNSGLVECGDFARFLTRRELELGQTLPIGYTDSVSYNQMQDLVGDCWTVDAIVEFFKNIKIEDKIWEDDL